MGWSGCSVQLPFACACGQVRKVLGVCVEGTVPSIVERCVGRGEAVEFAVVEEGGGLDSLSARRAHCLCVVLLELDGELHEDPCVFCGSCLRCGVAAE